MAKTISGIKKSPFRRRLALSMAGFGSSSRYAAGGLGNLLKSPAQRRDANRELLAREAERFVAELGKLKGAYVKIGQMLGIYGQYILPDPITEALQSLNDRTAEVRWSTMDRALKTSLGPRYKDFAVNHSALAAASLGQVHSAVYLPENRELCLKIQYPGMAKAIDSDFRDVVRVMRMARWLRGDRESEGLLEEVHTLLKLEIDYLREAAMGQRIRQLLQGDQRYLVPEIYGEFCSPTLLAMEFVDGHKFTSPTVTALPQAQRNAIAQAVLELFFQEIFHWRLMQTDPNFGNYLVVLDSGVPQLALLDFGAVREFDAGLMDALCQTIAGAVDRDLAATTAGLNQLGCFRPDQGEASKTTFAEFCFLLVEPFRPGDASTPRDAVNARGEYCWAKANLVKRAARLGATSALDRDFSVPPREFALITRKLSGVFGAMAALGAELNTSELLASYIARWRAAGSDAEN